MPTFNMLVGIPRSGKTTFRDTLEGKIVCPDDLRQAVYQSDFDYRYESVIWRHLVPTLLRYWAEAGEDIIFDATNVDIRQRRAVLNTLRSAERAASVYYNKAAYCFNVPLETAMERNRNADRVVPENVIRDMFSRFTMPTWEEGFDEIILLVPRGRGYSRRVIPRQVIASET